jgi:hypothetical protein
VQALRRKAVAVQRSVHARQDRLREALRPGEEALHLLRASLRRSSCSATAVASAGFPFPAASYVDAHPPMAVARPLYGRAAEEVVYVAVPAQKVVYDGLPVGAAAGARTAAVSLVSLPFIEAALPSAMLVQNICTLVLMLFASGDNRS